MDLTLDEAIPLGYVMATQLADAVGVRALAIKGPVLQLQGVRAERQSADVDILVDPSAYEQFIDALKEREWSVMPHTAASALPHHSQTARHGTWPCELDIHHRYPGISLPPPVAFERIWASRSSVTIAGVDVPTPSAVASVVMHGLQLIRDFGMNSPRVLQFIQDLRSRPEAFDREELAQCAAALGAADTLYPILSKVGAPPIAVGTTPARFLRSWRLVSQSTGEMSVHLVAEAARTPPALWGRLFWRSVWLTDEEIRERFPSLANTRTGLLRARMRRLRRGLRALPTALRLYRQSAQGSGKEESSPDS